MTKEASSLISIFKKRENINKKKKKQKKHIPDHFTIFCEVVCESKKAIVRDRSTLKLQQ